MATLRITRIGGGSTVQDLGRPGYLAQGLSRGGAADRLALFEAAALLGQAPDLAALELTGPAGVRFDAPVRIALTGAPMKALRGGETLAWTTSHTVAAGDELALTPTGEGVWSYLSIGGGIETESKMGSRSAHLSAGIGRPLAVGETLPRGRDAGGETGLTLEPERGDPEAPIRILPSTHTHLFDGETLARFQATVFRRSPRGNRQGVRLDHDGGPFATAAQLSLLSETIVPGDIQMTGDGVPYLLGPECQSVGGYPRIGSVIPADMARAMQRPPSAEMRFIMVLHEQALADHLSENRHLARLKKRVRPRVRDPRHIPDLLRYQLIGGVTTGRYELEDGT